MKWLMAIALLGVAVEVSYVFSHGWHWEDAGFVFLCLAFIFFAGYRMAAQRKRSKSLVPLERKITELQERLDNAHALMMRYAAEGDSRRAVSARGAASQIESELRQLGG